SVAIGGTAAVGVASTLLLRTGLVEAGIAEYDRIIARGSTGLSISATQSEDFEATAVAGSAGGTAGVAGSASVAVLDNTTHAYIAGNVVVNGANLNAQPTQGVRVAAS